MIINIYLICNQSVMCFSEPHDVWTGETKHTPFTLILVKPRSEPWFRRSLNFPVQLKPRKDSRHRSPPSS